ncbi:tigger transposable element-derived protein 1-like [Aedes aegypti]|uniref:Uncharacterized protein n=1 Tax=Aedes aegypti TaxID=7159 RepID=A0A6I8U6Q2_AEDAE|nr:tigger transposable element-derived protein 1-like [Aedes aegypti]
MEKALVLWIEDNTQKRIPISGDMIKQKALNIYALLKNELPSTSEKQPEFKASNGWFSKFSKRYSLRNIKMAGESASADDQAAASFPAELKRVIEEGNYKPDQVFNADETGLFWRRMPSRTYTFKNTKCTKGHKTAKARVTLMFCSNASGDKLLKPMLINTSQSPRSMKNVNMTNLPVHWKSNSKAWMSGPLFKEWFHECFVPEVQCYMSEKGLDFKVILILDNAPSHVAISHPNVKVLFLPPNTTSLIQPLDQGVIAVFKKQYIKLSFRYVYETMERDPSLEITEAWKKFNIKHCVDYINLACLALKKSTLNGCWRPVWPECVSASCSSNDHQIDAQIMKLASAVGIKDLSNEEIAEMMKESQLSDEELLEHLREQSQIERETAESEAEDDDVLSTITPDVLKKGIDIAEQLADFFIDHDPCVERAVMFRNELGACMRRYIELLRATEMNPASSSRNEPMSVQDLPGNVHMSSDDDALASDDELLGASRLLVYESDE